MQHIFILIDWFTPAYKAGGPIQSIHNLVNSFQEEGVSFRVFTSNQDHDGTWLDGVQSDTWVRFNDQTEVYYASPAQRSFRRIETEVHAWKTDLVFINGLFSPLYNFLPAWKLKGVRKVVSARGMLHPGALSQKAYKKKVYLACWKLLGLHRSLEYHAAAVEEVAFIHRIMGSTARVHLAANYPRVMDFKPSTKMQADAIRFVSVALISPMKNHLLVLQQLRHVTSAVCWDVYGPVKDSHYFQQCLELQKQLPNHIQVNFHGDIPPHQVGVVLEQADAFILPSVSENFGHALFEALTAGKPIITSTGTPWNHLEQSCAGLNVDMTSNEPALAQAIDRLATLTGDEWHAWTTAARDYALAAVDLKQLQVQYSTMFKSYE